MNSLLHTCLNIEMLVVLMLLYNFMIMHILYLNFLLLRIHTLMIKCHSIYIYIYSHCYIHVYMFGRVGGGGGQIFCNE